MKYLTNEQIVQLTAQRRKALLRSVEAKVGKRIDSYFDFEPDLLSPDLAKLNDYRKMIRQIIRAGVTGIGIPQ